MNLRCNKMYFAEKLSLQPHFKLNVYTQLDDETWRQMCCMMWTCVNHMHKNRLLDGRHIPATANLLSNVTLLFSVRCNRKETEGRKRSNNSYEKRKRTVRSLNHKASNAESQRVIWRWSDTHFDIDCVTAVQLWYREQRFSSRGVKPHKEKHFGLYGTEKLWIKMSPG